MIGYHRAGTMAAIDVADSVGVSVVSCYEIALAARRGRLLLPCPALQWFEEALDKSGIKLLPVTAAIADWAVNRLAEIHRDPFDRIIIASALANDALLVSADSLFPRYPELQRCSLDKSISYRISSLELRKSG